MSEWIKCSDRMPSQPGCYLVFADGYNAGHEMEWSDKEWVDCAELYHIEATGFGVDVPTITHWQPLPAPPEEEK